MFLDRVEVVVGNVEVARMGWVEIARRGRVDVVGKGRKGMVYVVG